MYKFNEEKHVHTFEERPLTGTSSIGNVLAKNLTWWAAELAAIECLEAGIQIPGIREEYTEAAAKFGDKKKFAIDALQKKYPIFKKARFAHFNKKNDTAKAGTDLHAELERFVKDQIHNRVGTYDPKIQPFIDWSAKNVKRFLWSEAHCYSTELWIGGIIDAGAELIDDKIVIFDFKSSKETFISQFLQATGYAIQIEENGLFNDQGNQILKLDRPIDGVAIVPFGAEVIEPAFRYDMESYKRGFRSAVDLYRLMGLN